MAPSSFSISFPLCPSLFSKSNKNGEESHYITQAVLELSMFLTWLPKRWGDRDTPPHPAPLTSRFPRLRFHSLFYHDYTRRPGNLLPAWTSSAPPTFGRNLSSCFQLGPAELCLLSAVQLGSEQLTQTCPGLASMGGIFMVGNWEGVSCSC